MYIVSVAVLVFYVGLQMSLESYSNKYPRIQNIENSGWQFFIVQHPHYSEPHYNGTHRNKHLS